MTVSNISGTSSSTFRFGFGPSMLFGDAVPTSEGIDSDLYIRNNAGNESLYVKVNGTWVNINVPTYGGTINATLTMASSVVFQLDDGSVSAPALTYSGDVDNGLYRPSDNVFGIAAGGNEVGLFVGGTSDVNYIQFSSNVAGQNPIMESLGDDTDIGLRLDVKGNADLEIFGTILQSDGGFSAADDAAYRSINVKISTTDATVTDLLNNGTEAIAITDDTTILFEIQLVARRTDVAGESAGYRFFGVIERATGVGTTQFVDTPVKEIMAEDDSDWDANVTADTSNGTLDIEVTGEAGKTIRWVASVSLTQVKA